LGDSAHHPDATPDAEMRRYMVDLRAAEVDQTGCPVLAAWIKQDAETASAAGDFYKARIARGTILSHLNVQLACCAAESVPPGARIVEIGGGFGGLAVLLSALGFGVTSFEMTAGRFDGARVLAHAAAQKWPHIEARLNIVNGCFPMAFTPAARSSAQPNVLVAADCTSTVNATHMPLLIESLRYFDTLIICPRLFGVARSQVEVATFLADLAARGLRVAETITVDSTDQIVVLKNDMTHKSIVVSTRPGAS
jgi:hypothetical protein